jgi:hypothetical protein
VNKNRKRGWFRSGEEDGGVREPSPDSAELMVQGTGVLPMPTREHPDEASIDLHAILDAAGISRDDRDRVERARNLLHALPTGVSAAFRRQIVGAALSNFGIATELIVDASQKVSSALAAFISSNHHATEKLLEDARARVQALEQEVFRVRQAAEQASAVHEKRIREANAEMVAVGQVLDFFSGNTSDVEFDEPTEELSDWGVELPIPPPGRGKRDTASATKPPPVRAPEAVGGKQPDPSKPQN